MFTDWKRYEEKVYTALLGKVAGVYFGRPIEGRSKAWIQEKFGPVLDHYCADEMGVPLIVTDDDISGTFTFIRALEDSGLFAQTPDRFFGDTWLNYLLEKQTILWWGGMCFSTEHTAYLRLKNGIHSPASGSIAMNGQTVAEQIGAQIFIDAFGMVAPCNVKLAAELAAKAARVSHDGEAVYAAQVVAAMVSAAFDDTLDMEQVLDQGVSVIPEDSLIAQIHRDVRAWAKEDGDWNRTFDRINEKYGYHKYGGGCHVVPNHAVMVMAWAYAGNDFHKAMQIVNTAGWDTDCNAANVGSVSALVAGLDGMKAPYDYLSPFADRVYVPTAEGTFSTSDVACEAYRIAAIGRRIAGIGPAEKQPGFWHFTLPGSVHGFMAEQGGRVWNENGTLMLEGKAGDTFMRPVLIPAIKQTTSNYGFPSTPLIYPGVKVLVDGENLDSVELVRQVVHADNKEELITAEPDEKDVILAIGFRFREDATVRIRSVDFAGDVRFAAGKDCPECDDWNFGNGWINSMDNRIGSFSSDGIGLNHMVRNEGMGVFVTGNRYWKDCTMRCKFNIHGGDNCGLIVRYQGQKRFYALAFEHGSVRIVKHYYDEVKVLAEAPFTFVPDRLFPVSFSAIGSRLTATVEGLELTAEDDTIRSGGCGYHATLALCGTRETEIEVKTCYSESI